MLPGGGHQVPVQIVIDDSSVRRFVREQRAAISAISAVPSRAGPRQREAITGRLAEAEAALRRNVSSGALSQLAARGARRELRETAGSYGIDHGAVRAQATEVNRAIRRQAAVAKRAAARAEADEQAIRAAAKEATEAKKAEAAAIKAAAADAKQATARKKSDDKAREQADRAKVHEAAVAAKEQDKKTAAQPAVAAVRVNKQEENANRRLIASIDTRTTGQRQLAIQARLAAARQAAADDRLYNAELRAANAVEDAAQPRFKRVQQALQERATGQYRPAESFAGLGQLLGSRALSVVSYAAPGALLFGALRNIREVGQEVLKLERVTARLRSQFDELGDSAGFRQFRSDLLGIARDTGVAGDQVAFVGLQMRGAFDNSAIAIERTEQAIRAAQVSGLDLVEIVDSLTAASITYKVSIDEITDKAIGLEQRFGVVNQQSIKAFGDLSPVAEQAGLSLDKVGAILGVIQQRSGRATSSITEALGRILPSIGEKAADLVAFARQAPALAADAGRLAQALNEGRTGDALLLLTERYEKLTETQKANLTFLLGGRREAQTLAPLFAGSADVTEELAKAGQDAGKAAKYQAEQQRTLGYQLARVREQVNELGDALAQLGVLGGLALVAGGVATVVGLLGDALRTAVAFNDALGGIPATLVSIYTALKTVNLALATLTVLQNSNVIGAITTALSARAAAAGIVTAGGAAAAAGVGTGGFTALTAAGGYGAAGTIGTGAAAGAGLGLFGLSTVATLGLTAAVAAAVVGLKALHDAAQQAAEDERRGLEGKDFGQILAARAAADSLGGGGFGIDFGGIKDAIGDGFKGGWRTLEDFAQRYSTGTVGPPGAQRSTRGTGYYTASETDKALATAAIPIVQAGQKSGLLTFGAETEKILADLAKTGTYDAKIAVERVTKAYAALSEEKRLELEGVADALDLSAAEQAKSAAGITANVASITDRFQRGRLTSAAFIAALREAAAVAKSVRSSTPENAQAAVDAENAVLAALQDRLLRTAAIAEQLAVLGGASSIESSMETARALLDDANISQAPDQALSLVDTLIKGYKDLLARAIENAEGKVKEALILNGLEISAEDQARIARLYAALGVGTYVAPPSSGNPLADELAGLGLGGGPASTTFVPTPPPTVVKPDAETVADQLKAEAERAKQEAEKARRAAAELAQARFALLAAQAGDNSILLAQIKLDQAKDEQERAKLGTLAEQLNAEANRVAADRGMRDAFRALGASMRAVASALAASVGDMAEVGRLSVEDARAELDRARTEGGPTEINNATAALINAEAAERDRARQSRIDDLEYLFEFDRITANQLIKGLTAELALIPETNVTARREIERRIRAIREELGRDMQFGIAPIELPAFYEIQRLRAGGYQPGRAGALTAGGTPTGPAVDNRSFSISIGEINNGGDLDDALSKIVSVVGGPSRFSSRPRQFVDSL